jgi:hypothetical protein
MRSLGVSPQAQASGGLTSTTLVTVTSLVDTVSESLQVGHSHLRVRLV